MIHLGEIGMSLEEARRKKHDKMKRRFFYRSVVLAILVGALLFALISNFNRDTEVYRAGDEAPDFELVQINENNELETVRLSDLRGKGVMLNFWATYCPPCEKEMPYMESLYPKYKDDIEIVAVNLDQSELVIHKFINKHDLTFPVVHDKNNDVMDLYKVKPLPSTFFIDPEGIIVEKVEGALTLEKLEEYFQMIQP